MMPGDEDGVYTPPYCHCLQRATRDECASRFMPRDALARRRARCCRCFRDLLPADFRFARLPLIFSFTSLDYCSLLIRRFTFTLRY